MTTSNLKHWLSRGELDKLENVVLEGRGARLLGEQSPDLRTRVFLKGLPNYLTKISQVHDAVLRGSLPEVQRIVEGEPKKKLVIAKDSTGTPLIHKAVYYDHQNVVEWIVDNYPATVEQKDKEGRTALHYCAACTDPEAVWDILIEAGCDASVCDKRGNPAAYYLQRGAEIELPDPEKMPGHRGKRRHAKHDNWQCNSLDFKPSNIRIWIHNRDIGKLQQVLWEGHGAKLRCETSNNVRVKRFLEAVPFIMGTIKDIHTSTVKNDIDTFRKKIEEPVSPIILSSKDSNGLNVLHKAAGLGHVEIAKEILEKYPPIVSAQDSDGRIPLHYAAVCRDGGVMYDLLVEYGSDESKLDNRGKTAAFYKNRPMDVDLANLVTVPEAPRVSGANYPRHWDWRIIDSDQPLPRIKRTGNNADDDSAFGSAESAKLTEDIATPEAAANDEEEEEEEEREAGDREEEEDEEQPSPAADDEEALELAENGTMEQLAALVLSGEGHRLVNRHSSNPELQAFIDNVPTYMSKIRAVHKAAKEGNLKELQVSLDRRKFAMAKDQSSPHGATPLHVAVIFGHTTIVRYLAGRFPETTHALDLDGRTPLHYAATLADNGHYYNLLLHLGANPLVQDNFGQKAEYYKNNQDDLSHKQLLRDFGAPESLADEMLVDKVANGDTTSARRDVTEPETLATLERCFRLLTSGVGGGASNAAAGGGGGLTSSGRRSSVPMTASASGGSVSSTSNSNSNNAGTLLGRCLRRQVFEKIKHRVTCMDHNLFDVIWPALKKYSNAYASSSSSLEEGNLNLVRERRLSVSSYDEDFTGNVVAPDFESYVVFAELLDPLIRDLHCVTATGELPDQPAVSFFYEQDDLQQAQGNASASDDRVTRENVVYLESRDLDPSGKYIMAGVIECTRNFVEHQLPLTMRINELEDTERIVTGILIGPELTTLLAEGSSEDEAGTYYTLSEIMDPFNEVRAQLAGSGLLLPISESENSDERRLHGKHWPYGRGVYVTSAGDLAVWVNVQDHIRVICCSSESRPGRIGKAYVRLARVVAVLDRSFDFRRDRKLGFLTSRPCALGNTLRFDIIIKLTGLAKKPDDLKHLCVVRGLRIHPTLRRDTVRLGNQQSLSIGELQTYQDFDRAVLNVITLEREFALNSSHKIASVIANIFKRRRLSSSRSVKP